jgi:hypothetical protein
LTITDELWGESAEELVGMLVANPLLWGGKTGRHLRCQQIVLRRVCETAPQRVPAELVVRAGI